MTATSGPGFSLLPENLGFACITETPCVVVNVMRGGGSTGLPTCPGQGDVMQARWGTHGDRPVIALVPASIPECFFETIRAFNLSEKYRLPVIVLLDEVLGHMREAFVPPKQSEIEIINRKNPSVCNLYDPREYKPFKHTDDEVPAMAAFGSDYRFHVTGLYHDETGFPTNDSEEVDKKMRRLMGKVSNNLDDIIAYEEAYTDDAECLVVAYGSTSRSAASAIEDLRKEGVKVGLFRPKTIWPFPEDRVRELAGKVSAILVPELNMGQVSLEVERVTAGRATVRHLGRVDGELITPEEISEAVKQVMA